MNLLSRNLRTMTATVFTLGLVAGIVAPRAQADEWDKKTILTVNQPIQIQERFLPTGQYVLKLLNSNSDRHIVQIFNSDQSQIIDTVLAIPNYRLQPTGKSQFLFWETPPGNAKAMRAWFYPGDNFGQEFQYPKHLYRLEAMATTMTQPAPAPTPEPATVTQPETTPSAEVSKQEVTKEEEKQPTEVAENAAPPAPAPTPEEPSANRSTEEQAPATLPKTSSLYPLIGLSGFLSLGLYGLLRLRRTS